MFLLMIGRKGSIRHMEIWNEVTREIDVSNMRILADGMCLSEYVCEWVSAWERERKRESL